MREEANAHDAYPDGTIDAPAYQVCTNSSQGPHGIDDGHAVRRPADRMRAAARTGTAIERLALFLSLAALLLSPGPASAEDTLVFALCYHSFIGSGRHPGDVSMKELASQLDGLSQKGFRFVTLSEAAAGRATGPRNILVTIDDGNASVYAAFYKVFKPRGIRPLLCIYPAVIGRRSYSLGWDRLERLTGEGCEVAAHGYYHLPLTERLNEQDPGSFAREIALSKKVLEERLGVRVRAFAYPNGVHNEHAVSLVRGAGYRYAFTIAWGAIRVPSDLSSSGLVLPRYMIYEGNWPVISGAITKRAASVSTPGIGASGGPGR
jgi:peptidoglycan/xylan/chitin deacetylase (PgdA/CDA1 family)